MVRLVGVFDFSVLPRNTFHYARQTLWIYLVTEHNSNRSILTCLSWHDGKQDHGACWQSWPELLSDYWFA